MLKDKINCIFLLIIITISLLFISGCSSILLSSYGSIEVTTYPSGAKIFLDGKDIEHVTPYTIDNLAKGTYEITVTLGSISYTEKIQVYSNNASSLYKDFVPNLNKIVVQPSFMNLEIGESKSIDSVIAYYIDSGSTALNPSDCNYSSSSNHAIVDSVGTITGVSKGSATITVSYTDVEITKTDSINVFIKIEAPKAVINVAPSSSGYAPFTVSFDASNSTDIGGIESYGWNFGDGSTGAGMTTNHTYNTPGTYIVTLTVTDFYGNKGRATISIIVREVGCPNANIQVTPGSTGAVPFTVSFDASGSSVNEESGSSITSYSWDFGDGDTDIGIITTHTYNNIGLYPVILTITDSNGKKDYATVTITVNEPGAPTAVISTVPDPPTGFAPLEMHFDAYNSSADVDITSYDWVFGDGSIGTGASINHTFNTAGTYVTSLTVTDSNGKVGYDTVVITVTEPTVENITVSANPESNVPGGTSTISAIVTDSEGEVVPNGTTVYFYTNSGALSDDSADTINAIATVTLTLNDNMLDGAKAKVTAFIGAINGFVEITCVEEGSLEAKIITVPDPPTGIAPFEVYFDAHGSSTEVIDYDWDFGDDNTGTGITAENTYTEVGTYTAVLTVTNSSGKKGYDSVDITVVKAPSAKIDTTPAAEDNLIEGDLPFKVYFNAYQSTSESGIVSYGWEFGDGDTGDGITVNHIYNIPGIYIVYLTITDSNGYEAYDSVFVAVGAAGDVNAVIKSTPDAEQPSGTDPFTVGFDASDSTTSASGATIISYTWDFDDGALTVTHSETPPIPVETYTFTPAGTHLVQLTVEDSEGNKGYAFKSIEVTSTTP